MEVTKEFKLVHQKEFKDIFFEIKWHTVFQVAAIYLFGVIGFYQLITGQWKLLTFLWTFLIFLICGFSMNIGTHRLFGHKSFKTNRALKLFLIFGHTLSGQWSIINYVRSHRAHHKYTDTKKDPTNIKNGFLFSHLYWMFWYSPAVKEAVLSIDVSDLTADKDLVFQYDYFLLIHLFSVAIFPVMIPALLWNEAIWIAFFANFARMLVNLSQISVFNSVMHSNGAKPYDEKMSAVENIWAIIFTFGEGFHNYHHTFPFDYKSGEFGDLKHFNLSAYVIDFWHKLGWITDKKEATATMIAQMKIKSGDGTHWFESENIFRNPQWGHGDEERLDEYFKDFDL